MKNPLLVENKSLTKQAQTSEGSGGDKDKWLMRHPGPQVRAILSYLGKLKGTTDVKNRGQLATFRCEDHKGEIRSYSYSSSLKSYSASVYFFDGRKGYGEGETPQEAHDAAINDSN